MNSLENFKRNAILLVAFCMAVSFAIGWRICDNYSALKIQRNSVEQSSNITLTVVDKGIKNDLIFGIPNQYYIVLSNNETIYVSQEEYQKYETNKSYDFELLEQVFVRHRIKPYNSGRS